MTRTGIGMQKEKRSFKKRNEQQPFEMESGHCLPYSRFLATTSPHGTKNECLLSGDQTKLFWTSRHENSRDGIKIK